MIIIYSVFANKDEAQKIVKILLEKQMIVCANMHLVTSQYLWEDKIKESEEVVAILKTLKQNYKRVRKEIEAHHSYEAPLIASIKVSKINGPYYNYLKKHVKKYYSNKSPEAKPNLKNPDVREK